MADIRIDQSVATIPEQLAGINQPDDDLPSYMKNSLKLFNSMAEALVFASLLGASHNRSKPVENPRAYPIKFSIFESSELDSYIYLLAINESKGFELLEDESLDRAIMSFESYAFGGLEIISEWVEKSGKGLSEAILDQMSTVASEAINSRPRVKKKPTIMKKKRSLLKKEV